MNSAEDADVVYVTRRPGPSRDVLLLCGLSFAYGAPPAVTFNLCVGDERGDADDNGGDGDEGVATAVVGERDPDDTREKDDMGGTATVGATVVV